MKTRGVNPYRQRLFYHLNTARVRTKQTKPQTYVPKSPVIKIEKLAEQVRQAEQVEKRIIIRYVEHYFGRPLTPAERKNLLE